MKKSTKIKIITTPIFVCLVFLLVFIFDKINSVVEDPRVTVHEKDILFPTQGDKVFVGDVSMSITDFQKLVRLSVEMLDNNPELMTEIQNSFNVKLKRKPKTVNDQLIEDNHE